MPKLWYNITMKKCKKCLVDKDNLLFSKRSSSKDGLDPYCKDCKYFFHDKWKVIADPKKIKQTKKNSDKKWYAENKDKKLATNSSWKNKNKDYVRGWFKDYKKKRESIDVCFKISNKLRTRLWHAIKNNQKTGSAVSDLGCSIEELKKHLESQFEPWMNWDNYGPYNKNSMTWQIDHIKALANFDLNNREELKIVCHFSNLQPLKSSYNLSKSNN